jgi:hypothetical protein
MDPTSAYSVQQATAAGTPAAYTGRAAALDRRSAKVMDRAREAGVSITYMGMGPLFAETRAYPGPGTDWVIGPVTSCSAAVVPRAERAALQRLIDAGIDFPMIYIAHEVPKGRLDIPDNSKRDSRPTTVDQATADAAVGPVPPPEAATALADQLGHRSQQLLRAMGIALAGAGAIAAAPFLLAGAAAVAAVGAIGALGLDPIIFGVIPAGQPVPGELAAWYILARWDWPAAQQTTP